MNKLIPLARKVAAKAHAGQKHRDGQPALLHSLRVAKRFSHDPELFAIAVLHDTLEDTDLNLEDLRLKFGRRVADGVLALTRLKNETWATYMMCVKANRDAVLVKIADIEDNLARMDAKMKPKESMYRKALAELRELAEFQAKYAS